MFRDVSFTAESVNAILLNVSLLSIGNGDTRERYEEYIYQRVQSTNIEQVSREEKLSWDQVQGIFNHKFAQKKTQPGVR